MSSNVAKGLSTGYGGEEQISNGRYYPMTFDTNTAQYDHRLVFVTVL